MTLSKRAFLAGSAALALHISRSAAVPAANSTTADACLKDVMFVFDASGSMATTDLTLQRPHIDNVRAAVRKVLPEVPPQRRMGLIIYGQGAYNACDSIELKLRPEPNSGPAIVAAIDSVRPAGRTPLTEATKLAAELLDYRSSPGVVVLLTDGEETCGGQPCDLAKKLKAEAADLTIHVVGYRNREAGGLSAVFGARCLAEETRGLFQSVQSTDQLIDALRKTLTCPLSS